MRDRVNSGKKWPFIVFIFAFFIITKTVIAKIWLNEIYPAPASGDYEWVELYNDSTQSADLSAFNLTDLSGNKIKLPATIAGSNYAVASCSSVLNNSGDSVFLKSTAGELIESVSYPSGISSNQSYAKCPDAVGIWHVSDYVSRGETNATLCQSLTPEPTLTTTPYPTPTMPVEETPSPVPNPTPNQPPPTEKQPTDIPTSAPLSTGGIYLSEAYVYPETGEHEWVEIYNDNNEDITLTDWYLDDAENSGTTPKKILLNLKAKKYGTVEMTSSVFNNDEDQVRLLDPQKRSVDDFEYANAVKGKSFGRSSLTDDNFCLQESSRDQPNSGCIINSPTPEKISTVISATAGPHNDQKTYASTNVLQSHMNLRKLNNSSTPEFRQVWSQITPDLEKETVGSVLGVATQPDSYQDNKLTFLSFSYSILAGISILLKAVKPLHI